MCCGQSAIKCNGSDPGSFRVCLQWPTPLFWIAALFAADITLSIFRTWQASPSGQFRSPNSISLSAIQPVMTSFTSVRTTSGLWSSDQGLWHLAQMMQPAAGYDSNLTITSTCISLWDAASSGVWTVCHTAYFWLAWQLLCRLPLEALTRTEEKECRTWYALPYFRQAIIFFARSKSTYSSDTDTSDIASEPLLPASLWSVSVFDS